MGQRGLRPRNSTLSLHISPQNPNLVIFQEPAKVNTTQLPPFTTKGELLNWADTKGPVTSAAELNNPQSILLRLDQGQLPQQPLWVRDSALEECEFPWLIPWMGTLRH